jgi:hypothetical protein
MTKQENDNEYPEPGEEGGIGPLSRRQVLEGALATIGLSLGGGAYVATQQDKSKAGVPVPDQPEETETQTDTTTETENTTTTETDIPDIFQLDFQFEKNQEKRNKLREVTQDGFLENNILNTPESRIVQNHSTEQQYDNQGIDLTALQLHHQNNWKATDTIQKIVNSIPNPNQYTEVKNNGDYIPYAKNHFDKERVETADSLEDVYQPTFAYIGNFEKQVNNRGLLSTRDTNYAAIIQETTDRHAPINGHTWAYKMNFGRHGFMSGYDKENDQIIPMETVADSPIRGFNWARDLKPLGESVVTDSDTMWHPVQFAREEYNEDFEQAKMEAFIMFAGVGALDTSGEHEMNSLNPEQDQNNIAPTTGFIKDVANGIGNYNENNYDFNIDIKNTSLATNKMRMIDQDIVIDEASYEEDQVTLEAYDITEYENNDTLMSEIWQDENGKYDNFGDILNHYQQNDLDSLEQAAEALAN